MHDIRELCEIPAWGLGRIAGRIAGRGALGVALGLPRLACRTYRIATGMVLKLT
jgi:hypothetical protein